MRTVNTDLLAGILGLLITVVFWQARENWMPLSATWPNTILVFMLIFSLALMAKAMFVPGRHSIFAEGSRRRMLVTACGLVVWALGMRYVGFVTASFVAFLCLWWYVGHAVAATEDNPEEAPTRPVHYLRAGAIIAVIIGAFYLTFTRVLHVPLPRGLII